MDFDLWLTYLIACTLLSLIPGPSILLVTGLALTRGLKAAYLNIAGAALGGAILIMLSLLGVGALLQTSATLFTAVKWLGVAYLAFLGITQIRNTRQQQSSALKQENNSGSFASGFFTALLNPKSIVFYMAFISQFIDPAGQQLQQYSILIITALSSAAIVMAGYSLLAARTRRILSSRRAQSRIGYTSGGLYLGGSLLMASTR